MITFRSSWEFHANRSGKCMKIRPPKLCETWSRISRQYAPVPEPDQLQERELTIELNPDGFPIAPDPASLEKTTKADLETLYRRYITSHYCKLSKMHFQYDKE